MAKRNHKKKRQIPVRFGETATPQRRKQLGGVIAEAVDCDASGKSSINRHRAALECVLDFYWRTLRINDAQHEAGIRFRKIYLIANMGFANKILGDAVFVNNAHTRIEDRMLHHIASVRLLEKVRKNLSPAQDRLIMRVCGDDQYAGTNTEKKTLRRALDVLARYWNLLPPVG